MEAGDSRNALLKAVLASLTTSWFSSKADDSDFFSSYKQVDTSEDGAPLVQDGTSERLI